MSRIGAFGGLVLKEALHILRDRRTLAVVLAMPVIQMVLFGYALQTDVEEVRVVLVTPSPDIRTRELAARFRAVPEYRVTATVTSARPVEQYLQAGEADQAVLLKAGFAADLRSADPAEALVVTDGTSPVTAPAMEGLAVGVLRDWARTEGRMDLVRRRAAAGGRGVEARSHFAFNPTLESQHLFVPGLLAFILTIISTLLTAITVAREKETGTMEVLLASPLRPGHIIPGKVVPYLALAFVNALTTLALARWVFGVPLRGSLVLLLAESVLYVGVCLALGVLISTRTPTQRTAMLGAILGTMLPTAILSGMIFPIESMPSWLQPVTLAVPARWFIEVVRGIMLKGATLETLWQETAVLGGMTAILLVASVRSFSTRLG